MNTIRKAKPQRMMMAIGSVVLIGALAVGRRLGARAAQAAVCGQHPTDPLDEVSLTGVRDVAGKPVHLGMRVYRRTVELRSGGQCCALFTRAALRNWLRHPNQPFTVGSAVWRPTGNHGVVLDVPMVFVSHRLSPQDLEALSAVL